MKLPWAKCAQEIYTESDHTNPAQEGPSDLVGDSMVLSASEYPTDIPFRLDTIICISTTNGQLIMQ